MEQTYYIRWTEQRGPGELREIPLGIYGGRSADSAMERAARESGLAHDGMSAEWLSPLRGSSYEPT